MTFVCGDVREKCLLRANRLPGECAMQREWIRFSLAVFLLVGLLAAIQPAWSQEVTASIVGTITDPSGAPIPNATVTAKDTERGTERTTTTNQTGAFNITRIPVGTYTVKVSASG